MIELEQSNRLVTFCFRNFCQFSSNVPLLTLVTTSSCHYEILLRFPLRFRNLRRVKANRDRWPTLVPFGSLAASRRRATVIFSFNGTPNWRCNAPFLCLARAC